MGATSPDGGIGRRARFRSVFRKEWRFESSSGHHSIPTANGINKLSLFNSLRSPYRVTKACDMRLRLVAPTRRKDSSNLQFEQRIPADLRGRLIGVTLEVPRGDGIVPITIT